MTTAHVSVVGCLGGGQLGLMLAEAGRDMGLSFRFLDPSPEACAASAGELCLGKHDRLGDVERFGAGLDFATYEFENAGVETVSWLAERVPTAPGPEALRVSQDRLHEKRLFQELGVPTPAFVPVDTRDELLAAAEALGLPLVVKTRRFGYDGKGQAVVRTPRELDDAWEALAGRPLIAEAFVDFERELSVIAARDANGRTAAFPLCENHHAGGILRTTIAPAPNAETLDAEAHAAAGRIMERLGYVGVMTLELFVCAGPDGRRTLLANEMAPRVHNSGHWTIEAARTSQFRQHLLALTGRALGDPGVRTEEGLSHAVMLNLIGTAPEAAAFDALAADAHAGGLVVAPHLYGKAPKPGRKLGHVTIAGPDAERTRLLALRCAAVAGVEPLGLRESSVN